MGNFVSRNRVIYNLDEEIIESTVRSLEEIQSLLLRIGADREGCLLNYRQWTAARLRTISALEKFLDELNTIHKYSSAGKVVGTGASILGGLATIVGFGMSFSRDLKPIGSELIKYGSALGGAGGATAFVSSAAGKGFSAKVLKNFKLALQEDIRLTEELIPWLRRAEELRDLFQEAFDCSAVDGLSDIFTAVREICVLCSKGSKALSDITEYLSLSLMKGDISPGRLRKLNNQKLEIILSNASEKVMKLLLGLCQSPDVLEAVSTLSGCFLKSPELFQLPKIVNCMGDMLCLENPLRSVVSMTGKTSSVTLRQGILQAVMILPNIYAFLSAVEDFKEGKSKYSDVIEGTIRCLKKELNVLQSYPELRMTRRI